MKPQDAVTATAFAPGHITGFFAIEDDEDDPMKIGSVGAGFSVEAGVLSRATVRAGGYPSVDLKINGKPEEATTSRRAVEFVLAKEAWEVAVEQRMDLPVGQGFGMSGAGALSAALAVGAALGRTTEESLAAAHMAEVVERTGLGDVVGSWKGGFEMRLKAGLPPHGRIEPFALHNAPRVLLAVVDDELSTRGVLKDPEKRDRIIGLGRRHVAEFQKAPSIDRFVELSRRFAFETGLASHSVRKALEGLAPPAGASQSMLGGSVFVLDPAQGEADKLRGSRQVITTKVATTGARVTERPKPVVQ